MRLRKHGVSFFLVAGAIVLGVALSSRPWKVYFGERKAAEKATAEMKAAEQRHTLDLEKEAEVGSGVGREESARQHGYVGPGESPLGAAP